MIWIIHALGGIFMWPLFLITATGHIIWLTLKLIWSALKLPFTTIYRLIKNNK